jgi:hypothetical protein
MKNEILADLRFAFSLRVHHLKSIFFYFLYILTKYFYYMVYDLYQKDF